MREAERKKLWERYIKTKSPELREQLILEYVTKNVKFETYASLRIRGAILDQIRKMDWIPRTLRQKQKRMDTAVAKLEADFGRPATADEISAELGISREEYEEWYKVPAAGKCGPEAGIKADAFGSTENFDRK